MALYCTNGNPYNCFKNTVFQYLLVILLTQEKKLCFKLGISREQLIINLRLKLLHKYRPAIEHTVSLKRIIFKEEFTIVHPQKKWETLLIKCAVNLLCRVGQEATLWCKQVNKDSCVVMSMLEKKLNTNINFSLELLLTAMKAALLLNSPNMATYHTKKSCADIPRTCIAYS